MTAVAYPHIDLAADGVPMISGTRTKVIEIVLDQLAHHWNAEEIQRQHPHLSLAQIHAALVYYYDHQEDLDREIERRLQRVDEIRAEQSESPLREKLRQLGRFR